jgi:hypothetical protein
LLLASSNLVLAGTVGYQFDITTHYQGGGGDGHYDAEPDTGYLTVQNNGASAFTGTVSLQNVGGGSSFSNVFSGITINPNDSFILSSGPEGSNAGGFGPNGLKFTVEGNVTLGAQTESVSLSVFDGDIHSGAVRISPCDGIPSDSFVLQGGSPRGCDNVDPFEVSQANGHYQFLESGTAAAPELASVVLFSTAIAAVFRLRRRVTAA